MKPDGEVTFCALPGFTLEVDLGEARPLPCPIAAGILDQGRVIKFVFTCMFCISWVYLHVFG